jgi:hypothetical protein
MCNYGRADNVGRNSVVRLWPRFYFVSGAFTGTSTGAGTSTNSSTNSYPDTDPRWADRRRDESQHL